MKTSTNSSPSYSLSLKSVYEVIAYFFTSIALIIVGFYRAHISPLIMNRCIYYPSCSQYAVMALKEAPFHIAVWSILTRILRCHPFSKGGYDPFQLKKSGGSCCE